MLLPFVENEKKEKMCTSFFSILFFFKNFFVKTTNSVTNEILSRICSYIFFHNIDNNGKPDELWEWMKGLSNLITRNYCAKKKVSSLLQYALTTIYDKWINSCKPVCEGAHYWTTLKNCCTCIHCTKMLTIIVVCITKTKAKLFWPHFYILTEKSNLSFQKNQRGHFHPQSESKDG